MFKPMIHHLATLPDFLSWFATAAAMLAAFVVLYGVATPWHDIRLIRAGNAAAACGWAGAVLADALVLAAIISGASSQQDLLSWGAVGLVVQLLALGAARLLLGPGLRPGIEAGQMAFGAVLGALALAAGIINAATMLY